jgi:hypothetical protein
MSDKVKRMCLRDKLSLYEMSKRTDLSCHMQRKWLNQAERLSPDLQTEPI